MRHALEKAGRPIVFSICEWGTSQPWQWARGVGHLWRTTFDIRPCWDCGRKAISNGRQIENFIGFTKILDQLYTKGSGLENRSTEVISDWPGEFPSDHFLIVTRFELKY
jgi:hypothetical protein